MVRDTSHKSVDNLLGVVSGVVFGLTFFVALQSNKPVDVQVFYEVYTKYYMYEVYNYTMLSGEIYVGHICLW